MWKHFERNSIKKIELIRNSHASYIISYKANFFQSRGGRVINNCFIPTLGSKGPQWGPFNIICLSIYLCLSTYDHPHRFLEEKNVRPVIVRRACGCRPRVLQYNLYSSTLSPSGAQLRLYVCLSFRPSVSLSGFPYHFLEIISRDPYYCAAHAVYTNNIHEMLIYYKDEKSYHKVAYTVIWLVR